MRQDLHTGTGGERPGSFLFLRDDTDTHTHNKVYTGEGHGDIEMVPIAGPSNSGTHRGIA